MDRVFSIKRFGRLLLWDLMANRRQYLALFFAIVIGAFLFCEFSLFDLWRSNALERLADKQLEVLGDFFISLVAMLAVIGPCSVCPPQRERQKLAAFLSLPASPLEKFVARYLITSLGLVLLAVGALVIAEGVRLAVGLVIGPHVGGSVLSYVVNDLAWGLSPDGFISAATDDGGWVFLACVLLTAMLVHMAYLLGGVLFRRKPLLLTTLAGLAMSYLCYVSGANFFDDMLYTARHSFDGACIVAALLLAVVAALYWLSYRLFCRMQITNHKWFNL